jgi:hypothetical protein
MPSLFPGEDPDEVETLLHRARYDAILHLLGVAKAKKAAGTLDARWQKGLAKLLAGLQKRSSQPDVGGGKSDVRFVPSRHAQHLAALAWLGDAKAKADLDKLIVDPAERGVAPWVAAEAALALDLPGAADRAVKLLENGIQNWTQRFSTELDPKRGFLHVNDHVRVLDALAARGDARFALGLLDHERWGREAAAVHFARLRPAAACELVGNAATNATREAVDDAFWVLSMLGDACKATGWRLANDPTRPAAVRGMALELLAMMRDARIAPLLPKRQGKDDIAASRSRARFIFAAKE